MEEFSKTINLIGLDKQEILCNKKIMIFGLGGVGSYTAEILARSGIGKFILIDNDTIDITNINRQLYALHSTIGKKKIEVAKERILDINPKCQVVTYDLFVLDNLDNINFNEVDYIIDCVDTVTAKLSIIEKAKELSIPIISSMGTGNKLDPTKFQICDIKKTTTCPLAKVMRYELKKRNIENVPVLFSTELPVNNSQIPTSISFVPSVAGILIARFVILDLIK